MEAHLKQLTVAGIEYRGYGQKGWTMTMPGGEERLLRDVPGRYDPEQFLTALWEAEQRIKTLESEDPYFSHLFSDRSRTLAT